MYPAKTDCRFEKFGSTLPTVLRDKPIQALWHPLLFDWVITLFSLGYGLSVLMLGPVSLHLGIFKGPVVMVFNVYALAFAGTMLVASTLGLLGLAFSSKTLRMKSSFFLVLAYVWLAVYYFKVFPLPWQAVFFFSFHAVLEALVYYRCATDPHLHWDQPRG